MLPKSICAQWNGTGSCLVGTALPSPEQNSPLQGACGASAVPREHRSHPAEAEQLHPFLLSSSASRSSHGQEGRAAGLGWAGSCSCSGPWCCPQLPQHQQNRGERAISDPNHRGVNPPRRVAAFKVCWAATGAEGSGGLGLFGLKLQWLWSCGEGEVG